MPTLAHTGPRSRFSGPASGGLHTLGSQEAQRTVLGDAAHREGSACAAAATVRTPPSSSQSPGTRAQDGTGTGGYEAAFPAGGRRGCGGRDSWARRRLSPAAGALQPGRPPLMGSEWRVQESSLRTSCHRIVWSPLHWGSSGKRKKCKRLSMGQTHSPKFLLSLADYADSANLTCKLRNTWKSECAPCDLAAPSGTASTVAP